MKKKSILGVLTTCSTVVVGVVSVLSLLMKNESLHRMRCTNTHTHTHTYSY